jgi:hypothetical protein
MRGSWEPQTNIFLLCMCIPSCYLLITCQLRLKTLCAWSRNLKIFIFFPNYADYRAFRPQGPGCYISMPFGKLLLILEHLNIVGSVTKFLRHFRSVTKFLSNFLSVTKEFKTSTFFLKYVGDKNLKSFLWFPVLTTCTSLH